MDGEEFALLDQFQNYMYLEILDKRANFALLWVSKKCSWTLNVVLSILNRFTHKQRNNSSYVYRLYRYAVRRVKCVAYLYS